MVVHCLLGAPGKVTHPDATLLRFWTKLVSFGDQNDRREGPRGALGSSWSPRGDMPEEPGRPRARSRGSRGSFRLPRERPGTIWVCKMDLKSMKFEPRGEPRGQFVMLNGATIDGIPASLEHRDVRRPSTESRDDSKEIPGPIMPNLMIFSEGS